MKINPLIHQVKESSTLAINQRAKKLRAQGKSIVHFGFGESPFPVPKAMQEALIQYSHHKEYLAGEGLEPLRQGIAHTLPNHCAEDIVIGPGSKELIYQSLFLLEGPLIIPAPSWVSYGPQCDLMGKEKIIVQTKIENGYKIRPEELEAVARSDGQKILIINSPNNPSGAVYTDKEVKELSDICRSNNVIIMADEIYAKVDFQKKFSSFAQHYPEGTIITSGISKAQSAGGYRLGFLASDNKALIRSLKSMISETFSCVASPIQYAAIEAYNDNPDVDKHIQACTDIHQFCSSYLYQEFLALGLNCAPPQGGFYLMPDFNSYKEELEKRNINTSRDLSTYLLEKLLIATLPGEDFYLPNDHLALRIASVDYNGEKALKAYTIGEELNAAFLEKYCPNLLEGIARLKQWIENGLK